MESDWGVEEQRFMLGSTILTSAVSFDEKLAAISTECEVHVWNLTTGKLEHVMSQGNSVWNRTVHFAGTVVGQSARRMDTERLESSNRKRLDKIRT
ncbi:hypothetical protein N7493_000657 [Penicillium malachiteum]|uniref:Uncharacterized protein n=1 Tax=Penicillium malachiteum TaxID=1324776 RepID=A0AAD6N1M8_9EURO|nr:hypothetical protein N7493_000657 [Penicillium malachiteum]